MRQLYEPCHGCNYFGHRPPLSPADIEDNLGPPCDVCDRRGFVPVAVAPVVKVDDEVARLSKDLLHQRDLNVKMAERIRSASEVLSRAAERKAAA